MKRHSYFLIILVFLAISIGLFYILNTSKKALDISEDENAAGVKNFSLIAAMSATNGEVFRSIIADGTNIFAAADFEGLQIYDSRNLTLLGSYKTNYPVRDVSIVTLKTNKYAVCALGLYQDKGGIMLLNINRVSNITCSGFFINTSNDTIALPHYQGFIPSTKTGILLYAADNIKGFTVYEINTSTMEISSRRIPRIKNKSEANIFVRYPIAYTAERERGYSIIELNHLNVLWQTNSSISSANSVYVSSNTLLIADRMMGIMLYDISDPGAPKYLGNYDTPGDAYDVAMELNNIYIADGMNGILKLDYTPPNNFTLEKQYTDDRISYKFYYDRVSSRLYVANGKDGFTILK